jgi:hypothetical protein
MSSYSGAVSWGQGGSCKLTIDDLDSESWTGRPDPSITILSSGRPFPWDVRVILLDGERAGDGANAELHVDVDASDAAFRGRGRFEPARDEYEVAIERRRILDELKAATDPEKQGAIFERLHHSLWGQDDPTSSPPTQ